MAAQPHLDFFFHFLFGFARSFDVSFTLLNRYSIKFSRSSVHLAGLFHVTRHDALDFFWIRFSETGWFKSMFTSEWNFFTKPSVLCQTLLIAFGDHHLEQASRLSAI